MCQLELHHPTDGHTENTEVSEVNLVMLISGGSTTTEQAFVPTHLSRLQLDPGPIKSFVPGVKSRTGRRQKTIFYPG